MASNPTYFGNLPDAGLDAVEAKTGDTTFEQLDCVSCSPTRDRIEATVQVKRSFGYSGGLCTDGSFEHRRFYVDDGSGCRTRGRPVSTCTTFLFATTAPATPRCRSATWRASPTGPVGAGVAGPCSAGCA